MILLIILAVVLVLAGLVGCIFPGIPGPPLSFLALLLLSFAKKGETFSTEFLLIMAALAVVVTVLDLIIPAAGARRFGASRAGFWGAILGMFLGLFLAPPWGIIVFTFLGALIAELLAGKAGPEALRAGWGVFLGIMAGTLLKLTASGIMAFYFFQALF